MVVKENPDRKKLDIFTWFNVFFQPIIWEWFFSLIDNELTSFEGIIKNINFNENF